MNFNAEGRQFMSTQKSGARVNPITGEEMPYSARVDGHKQNCIAGRPDGVPALDLGKLGGEDGQQCFVTVNCMQDAQNTASTVSWGTPSAAREAQLKTASGIKVQSTINRKASQQPIHESSTKQQNIKTNGSEKQKNREKGVEEMKLELLDHTQQNWSLGGGDDTAVRDLWTSHPHHSKAHEMKLLDKEELEAEKRKYKLIETVMIDQLSRSVISDPEQNEIYSNRTPSSYQPGMKRGSVRTLHDSKVATSGRSTENLLSRRVQFGARLLSRSGRDAIRELTGFFFAVDNTMTVYEFRQFGKSAKALPFIRRGLYRHLCSRRIDFPYTLVDIQQGATLIFESKDQPLPDTVKEQSVILLRITDVDDSMRAEILLDKVAVADRSETWKYLHLPSTQQEIDEKLLVDKVQDLIRRQIKRRGIKVYTGLGRQFRLSLQNDKYSPDGASLHKHEFEEAIGEFHVDIPQANFDDLWLLLNADNGDFMEYDKFLRCFLGEMNERRKALVRKAYLKIDAARKGFVTFDEMRIFYNVYKDPKVRAGECTGELVFKDFVSTFNYCLKKNEVTYSEFEEYYEGLSIGIDSDDEFTNVLRNAWNI